MAKETHLQRTAQEPRDESLHTTTITHIHQPTPTIRIFHLSPPPTSPIKFLPGQWLDLHAPDLPSPGGFTITSPPSTPHLELAIQLSPQNPVAAYLWQDPPSSLLGTSVYVRVGGSFTWPPPPSVRDGLRKVVFVAGGVGINPLVSMLSSFGEEERGLEVYFFYSLRDPGEGREAGGMLFLERVAGVFERGGVRGGLRLFLTSGEGGGEGVLPWSGGEGLVYERRRMTVGDVAEVVGGDKGAAVVYVCGVPGMTDGFVEGLTGTGEGGLGMERERVLFEKWW
ncbi:hypothetical protein QBC39DRAFT_303095 [Podospora conica]|nr:hypothetical protein QBC39DRAFT_303095 [Schizothecium conicum]